VSPFQPSMIGGGEPKRHYSLEANVAEEGSAEVV
jgi:hypothetical protein